MNIILQTLFAALTALLSLTTLDELFSHGLTGSAGGLCLITMISALLFYVLNRQRNQTFSPYPPYFFLTGCLYVGAYLTESVLSGLTVSQLYMPIVSGGCFYLYSRLSSPMKRNNPVSALISRETDLMTIQSISQSASQTFLIQEIVALTIDDGYLLIDTVDRRDELTLTGSREDILNCLSQLLSSEEQDQISLFYMTMTSPQDRGG